MKRNTDIFFVTLFLLLLLTVNTKGEITLPSLFSDGMVIQRGKDITLWGSAAGGERVTVSFLDDVYTAVADSGGHWRVRMPGRRAGGPYRLVVGSRIISDVLIGDVWLCSGQSNMDVDVDRVHPQYPDTLFDRANDNIRLLRVERIAVVDNPVSDITTTGWHHLNRANAWHFSAIGYFLARRMYELTGVPQGVICNSWGGVPIETFIPRDSLLDDSPDAYTATALYSDEYVERQNALAAQLNSRWQQLLNDADPGMADNWALPGIDDTGWTAVNQYALSSLGPSPLIGSLWLRQHLFIDAAHRNAAARLSLGTLYDCDYTYVNGQQVGVTYYQYPPRRYDIPAGLLHEGDNVITVRFVNRYGTPAFTKGKPYRLVFADGDTLMLSDTWRARVGALMPSCPDNEVRAENLPYVLYRSMLLPLAPYAIAGVVWYQGESNVGTAHSYRRLLGKLMGAWREVFHDDDLPFAIVQLAAFMQPSDSPQSSLWASLREEQRLAAADDEHAALVVTLDLGEANDIHPLRKKEVADRAAMVLQRLACGWDQTLSPNPLDISVLSTDPSRLLITFDSPLRDEKSLCEFEAAGEDGVYHNATAYTMPPSRFGGGKVIVYAPTVSRPLSVRYAWKDNPAGANLFGVGGLPVSSFQMKVGRSDK